MNIVVAGFGPHCTRVYWPFLNLLKDEFGINVSMIIDLKAKEKEIKSFLSGNPLKPDKIFLLNPKPKELYKLDNNLEKELNKLLDDSKIDALIITTEPRFHKMYLDWAIKHKVKTLVEKPLVAFESVNTNEVEASKIFEYAEKSSLSVDESNNLVSIQCQRRYNDAYDFAFEYLKSFISKYKVPISYIGIYQCDGLWNSPEEYIERESHPFKYGYGKLLHSGYHFVDIASYFLSLNSLVDSGKYDSLSVYSRVYRPMDAIDQIARSGINNFHFHITDKEHLAGLGELDSYNLVQLTRNGTVITTLDITTMQNSVSKRDNFDNIEIAKEKMGMTKQEEMRIIIGPLLMLKILLVNCDGSYTYKVEITKNSGFGDNGDFIYKDFKSVEIMSGKNRVCLPQNQAARFKLLRNFLSNSENKSRIQSHVLTNRLISIIYRNICKINRGEIPYERINI